MKKSSSNFCTCDLWNRGRKKVVYSYSVRRFARLYDNHWTCLDRRDREVTGPWSAREMGDWWTRWATGPSSALRDFRHATRTLYLILFSLPLFLLLAALFFLLQIKIHWDGWAPSKFLYFFFTFSHHEGRTKRTLTTALVTSSGLYSKISEAARHETNDIHKMPEQDGETGRKKGKRRRNTKEAQVSWTLAWA